MRMSSHSLDGELDGPQPNSIALQMSYPLVNVPPPPLQVNLCWCIDAAVCLFKIRSEICVAERNCSGPVCLGARVRTKYVSIAFRDSRSGLKGN